MDELQLTVEVNGEKRTYPPETTYREIAEEYQKDYPAKIILAKVDGRLRELTKKQRMEAVCLLSRCRTRRDTVRTAEAWSC